VRRSRPRAELILVGAPKDVPLATSMPGLTVAGPCTRHQTAAYIASARLLVLPSRSEAMPVVLTEAMAAATPFVSTAIEGIVDLANGDQPLVSPNDPAALAAALLPLLADPHRAAQLGERGYAHWRKTRSPEAVGPQLREIYRAVLAQSCLDAPQDSVL